MWRSFFQKFIDLLLYGNFFIAFCAVAMTFQTELLLYKQLEWTFLIGFVFFSTLFLYAIHRIVGLKKVRPFLDKYRYGTIYKFRTHIKIYAFIGGLGAFYFFFFLSFNNHLLVSIPAILSLGYVLPFVQGEKRLRDLDYLKIFLIAIVWAIITVMMPIFERTTSLNFSHFVIFLERAIFVFAITLPFDIRDLKVDAHIAVKTIPSSLGTKKTKHLAGACLLAAFLLAIGNFWLELYSFKTLIALFISYLFSFLLVLYSDQVEEDYFFTGLMDGTMIVQFILVVIFNGQ